MLLFDDVPGGALKGVWGGGDTAVLARFGVAIAFEDGDDGLFFFGR